MRFVKPVLFAMSLAALAVACGSASASTANPIDPNTGTWTYFFTLDTGVTYTIVTSGAIGSTNGNNISYTPVGDPFGYSNNGNGYVGTSNIDGNGRDEVEIAMQYTNPNDSNQLLVYSFVAERSFWATPGTGAFPNDGDSINGVQYWLYDPSFDPQFGPVPEGANYAFYNTGVPDPACTSCSVAITYVPSVAGVTPEPSSLILLATGSAGAWFTRRRRFQA